MRCALEADMEAVAKWIDADNLRMNIGKTQFMVLCRNRKRNMCDNLIISHKGVDIARKGSIRYLGVTVDNQLTEGTHSACKAKVV